MRFSTKISIWMLGLLAGLDLVDAVVHRWEPAVVRNHVLFAVVSVAVMILMFVRERRAPSK